MTDERQSRREQAIANICRKLLGETPTRIEFPGGRSRKTAIVYCGDAIYAVSRRGSVQRAVLEAAVLKQLFELGVPVPRLIASEDHWTIQEYLGDIRLSQGLDKAGPADRLKLMTMAVQGWPKFRMLVVKPAWSPKSRPLGGARSGSRSSLRRHGKLAPSSLCRPRN